MSYYQIRDFIIPGRFKIISYKVKMYFKNQSCLCINKNYKTELNFSPVILVIGALKIKRIGVQLRKVNMKRGEAKLLVCGCFGGQDA